MNLKNLGIADLMAARTWLETALGMMGPLSSPKQSRAIRTRLDQIDKEMWERLIGDQCSWRGRNVS